MVEAQRKALLGDDLFGACIGSHRQDVGKLLDERVATGSDRSTILATMMAAAAAHDRADVVAFCLERGVAVTDSVMGSIASNGSFASHQILIRAKAIDINYFIPWHGDALGLAATSNQLDWARFYLENGANPNLNKVDEYKTVLAAAAANGHQSIVELLLQHGAWLRGSGAIVLAAEAGQIDMVRLLLAKGADVNEVGVEDPTDERSNDDIGTALHRAISQGHVETAKFLIGAGASLEINNFQGRTPTMLAEQSHQTEMQNAIRNREPQGF